MEIIVWFLVLGLIATMIAFVVVACTVGFAAGKAVGNWTVKTLKAKPRDE